MDEPRSDDKGGLWQRVAYIASTVVLAASLAYVHRVIDGYYDRASCRGPPDIQKLFETYTGLESAVEAARIINPAIMRLQSWADTEIRQARELQRGCRNRSDYAQAVDHVSTAINALTQAQLQQADIRVFHSRVFPSSL